MSKHQKSLNELLDSLESLEDSIKYLKRKLESQQLTVTEYEVMSAYQNLLAQMGSLSWYITAYAKQAALKFEGISEGLGVA